MKNILPTFLIISIIGFVISSATLPGFAKGVVSKKKQLIALAEQGKNLPQLSSLLATQKEKFDLLERAFPGQEDLIAVVESIDGLAGRTGVSASMHFESEKAIQDEDGAFVFPISIIIEGDFENCIAFIHGLLNNQYLYMLKTIEGTSPTGVTYNNKIVIMGNLYAANE